tara:strand:+ start:316 stop:504 length:189 start_codon:yes stop_codon:yes gene_type:complete
LKVGDKVQFVLHDTPQTGSVLKIYEAEGWRGYANLLLENNHRVELPICFLSVIDEKPKVSKT